MFKLFFDILTVVAQIVTVVMGFMTFSITLALFLSAIQSAYKLSQQPMTKLIGDCLTFAKPYTPVSLIKWAFRVSFVLAPAICMKIIGACANGSIEFIVNMTDNGSFATKEPSASTD